MIKVLKKNGSVLFFSKAIAVAERSIDFNGQKKRITEPATDISNANAISFESDNFGFGNLLYVGNLPNSKVVEILKSDVVDFSDMEFQKAKSIDKLVLDGGTSAPYCSDFTGMLLQSYSGVMGFGNNIFGISNVKTDSMEEGWDEEGDEESYENAEE